MWSWVFTKFIQCAWVLWSGVAARFIALQQRMCLLTVVHRWKSILDGFTSSREKGDEMSHVRLYFLERKGINYIEGRIIPKPVEGSGLRSAAIEREKKSRRDVS